MSRAVSGSGFDTASFISWRRPNDGGYLTCPPVAATAECERIAECNQPVAPGGSTPNAGRVTVAGVPGSMAFIWNSSQSAYQFPTALGWQWAEGSTLTGSTDGGPDIGAFALSAAVPKIVRQVEPHATNVGYTFDSTKALTIEFDAAPDAFVFMRMFALDSALKTTWIYCKFAPGSASYVVPASMFSGLSGTGGLVFLTANESVANVGDYDVTFQVESRIPRADGGTFPGTFSIQ